MIFLIEIEISNLDLLAQIENTRMKFDVQYSSS